MRFIIAGFKSFALADDLKPAIIFWLVLFIGFRP
jgi:hypothetical protein